MKNLSCVTVTNMHYIHDMYMHPTHPQCIRETRFGINWPRTEKRSRLGAREATALSPPSSHDLAQSRDASRTILRRSCADRVRLGPDGLHLHGHHWLGVLDLVRFPGYA